MIASRELLTLDKDDVRVITNGDFRETQIYGDMMSTPNRLDTSFPTPPPRMPNTPSKYSPSRNARVPASISNPDSANEAPNNQLRSELELREIVRPRREKGDHEAPVVGVRERRQGTRWMPTLVPFFSRNASRE